MNTLKKNIYKDYVYTLLSGFNVTNGIWMLYLAYKGLSLFEIGLMETVYHLSSFSMEIPTGAVADILGRKTSRALGSIAAIISTLVMIFGQDVLAFGIGFFFSALANNLESGAGDALIYDSLKEIGDEDVYMKVRGRKELFYQIAKTASLILGGYIATLSYEKVYVAALVVSVVTALHTLSFVEPSIGKVEKKDSPWQTFKHQIISSFKILKNNKVLLEMILALEIFSTFYVTEFFYLQNHLKSLGHSELNIGIILAVGALFAAITATQAYKLEKRFSLSNIIVFSIVVAVMAFWGMTIRGVEKYAFVVLSAIEGLLFVVMGDYINKMIPSDKRATILSFQSMIFSLFMIVLFPVVGKLGDLLGLGKAFIMVAGCGTLSLTVLLYTILRRRKE